MKKIIIILCIILCSSLLFASGTTKESSGVPVLGVMGSVTSLSTSLDYAGAYAFQMNSSDVAPLDTGSVGNKTGVRVGLWSLTSNSTTVTVTISHDKLTHELFSSKSFDYDLGVQYAGKGGAYSLSYTQNGASSTTASGSFVVFLKSGDAQAITFHPEQKDGLVSIFNYGLFVRLAESATNASGGYYSSTIKISVSAE
jgi:hypothetical protein